MPQNRTTCAIGLGFVCLFCGEAALRSAELSHAPLAERPPAVAAILPRPVSHAHATGDGEVPAYFHSRETAMRLTSIAPPATGGWTRGGL
jgi:hypothetical protein